ncbi:MAG: COX15/CtaA family protein [Acetobacteraceae bacterium]
MPFDVGDFPGASSSDRAASRRSRQIVAGWLLTVAAMIVVMIGLGGATRLTGSGLSIMEWAPVRGILPPLSNAEWHRLFDLYKQIPQYKLVNADFQLGDFQEIFWLEWVHRLWGRLVGLAFIVPLIWFWVTGHISRALVPRLLGLFILGGLQGAVGWFMVASGFFPDSTAVSPYRLVVHLSLALILYAALLWTGLSVLTPQPRRVAAPSILRALAFALTGLVALTILAGGFVAGLHAGLDYNTFPLMDGRLIPDGYARLSPFLTNLTENIAAVQFNHRLLATLSVVGVAITLLVGFRTPPAVMPRGPLIALGVIAGLQYVLGVTTLLLVVPASLGTAHQVGATLLLTAAIVLLHAIRKPAEPDAPG